jgi:ABC-2 type transport system ATP-binding protein
MDLLGGISSGRSSVAEHYPQLPASCEPVVTAQHLTKLFGSFKAVDAVNLTIPRGQIYGLLGPNGAGKSTTFKMLCGLLPPSQGEGTVAGIDLLHAPAMARNRLGYMAQKFSLYGDLSVNDNLTFFARAYGLSGAKCNRAVSRMLNAFALQPYAATPAAALPLGFKQRLSLASALMHEPDILFLDEPTSGVDPITRREFWNHINSLVLKGVTILVTTHFMDEAEYCDRIAFIFGGRKIAEGSPDQLKERARTATCPTPTMEDAFIHLVQNGHLQTSQP